MYEIFSKLLQKYGVTPYKVSKETGVSQSTLSDWKRGISTPKPDKLQKIADYFGVPLTYFLSETAKSPKVEETQKLNAYEIFEKLCEKKGITPYRFCKDTGINSSTISTWKKKGSECSAKTAKAICEYFDVSMDYLMTGASSIDSKNLTAKDERDIAKDMESIRNKLLNGSDGPLSYDGEPIPEEDAELLLGQIELMMRRLKPINKEKYNPNKNKK